MLWRPRYTPAAKCHEWTRLIADFVGVKGEALRHVREAAELLEDAADATTAGMANLPVSSGGAVSLDSRISACLLAQSRPKNNPAKRAGKFEWREIQMGTRLAGRSHSLIGNSLIEERGHVMITARNWSCWRRHHEVPDGACVAPMFTPARITRCMYFS